VHLTFQFIRLSKRNVNCKKSTVSLSHLVYVTVITESIEAMEQTSQGSNTDIPKGSVTDSPKGSKFRPKRTKELKDVARHDVDTGQII